MKPINLQTCTVLSALKAQTLTHSWLVENQSDKNDILQNKAGEAHHTALEVHPSADLISSVSMDYYLTIVIFSMGIFLTLMIHKIKSQSILPSKGLETV